MNKEIIKKRFLKEFLSDPAIKFIVKNNLADIRDLVKEASSSEWRSYFDIGPFVGGALQSGTIEEQPPEEGKYFMTRGSSRAYLIFIKRAFSVLLRLMKKAEASDADIEKVKYFLEKRESKEFKDSELFSASPTVSPTTAPPTTTESTDRSISDEDRRLFLQSRIEDLKEQADILFLIQELLLLTFFLDGDKSQDNSVKEPLVVTQEKVDTFLVPVIEKLNGYTDDAFNLNLNEVPDFDNTNMKKMEDEFKPFKSTLYKIMYVTAQKLDKYRDDKHIKGEKLIDEIDQILLDQKDQFTDSAGSEISSKKLRKLAARLLYDKVDPKIFPVLGDIYEKWKATDDINAEMDKTILEFIAGDVTTEGIESLSDADRDGLKYIKVKDILKPSILQIFNSIKTPASEPKTDDGTDGGDTEATTDSSGGKEEEFDRARKKALDDIEQIKDNTYTFYTDTDDEKIETLETILNDLVTDFNDNLRILTNFKITNYDLTLDTSKWKVDLVDVRTPYGPSVYGYPFKPENKTVDGLADFCIEFINKLSIKIDKPKPTMEEFNNKKLAALQTIDMVQKGTFKTDTTDGREQLVPALERFLNPFRNDFGKLNDSNLFRMDDEGNLNQIGNIIPSLDEDKWAYNLFNPTGSIPYPESSNLETLSEFYKNVVSRITYRPEIKTVSESKNIKIAKTIIKLVEKQYQRKKHG